MEPLPPLPFFHTKEDFHEKYHNPALWKPFVLAICNIVGIVLKEIHPVPAGDEGASPVFIVNREVVVKLYTHASEDDDGEEVYEKESASSRVLAAAPKDVADLVPILRFSGTLVDERPNGPGFLHYAISDFLEGVPMSKLWDTLSTNQLTSFARQLGSAIYKIHKTKVPSGSGYDFLESSNWTKYLLKEKARLHEKFVVKYKSLPEHLVLQLDTYIPDDISAFVGPINLCWIHADLHRMHTFVKVDHEADTAKLSGIIDWGDALLGSPFFDLAVIHIDQFYGDKKLLQEFLMGYEAESKKDGNESIYRREDFVYRMMVNLLLFPFNQFLNLKRQTGIFCVFPEMLKAPNFEVMAEFLFKITY